MAIFCFYHPGGRNIQYTWDDRQGVLLIGEKKKSLAREIQIGDLLYRFLVYRELDAQGQHPELEGAPDLNVRKLKPKLIERLELGTDSHLFIHSIRTSGYQWLPEVKVDGDTHEPRPPKPRKLIEDRNHPLDRHRVDYRDLIESKTREFVGREFVMDAIRTFEDRHGHGYFTILGEPGIGKSALLAEIVRRRDPVHHFNIAGNVSSISRFMENLCAQLIVKYDLNHRALPDNPGRDTAFLSKLLNEVSDRERDNVIIVVDALDEAESGQGSANALFLPRHLPQKIFFVLSTRKEERVRLRFDTPAQNFEIDPGSAQNLDDIRRYVTEKAREPGVESDMKHREMSRTTFVETLVEKSEGNFMYIYHILAEIAAGRYRDRDFRTLPTGLTDYYRDHWQRMRSGDPEKWKQVTSKVILALTALYEPVSIKTLIECSEVDPIDVGETLRQWEAFIHVEEREEDRRREKRYRIYHQSYFDFIRSLDDVDLARSHHKIVNASINALDEGGWL